MKNSLTKQDIKDVKKLFLPSSVEEKLIEYLQLRGSVIEDYKPSKSLGYIVYAIVKFILLLHGAILISISLKQRYLNIEKYIPIETVLNITSFIFWIGISLGLVTSLVGWYNLTSKKKLISLSEIRRITYSNLFTYTVGKIVMVIVLVGLIFNGHIVTTIVYIILVILNYILKNSRKEEMKKALEELNETDVQTFFTKVFKEEEEEKTESKKSKFQEKLEELQKKAKEAQDQKRK
jgi:hypothetical protein